MKGSPARRTVDRGSPKDAAHRRDGSFAVEHVPPDVESETVDCGAHRARMHPADMSALHLLPDDKIVASEVESGSDKLLVPRWVGPVWPSKRIEQGRLRLPCAALATSILRFEHLPASPRSSRVVSRAGEVLSLDSSRWLVARASDETTWPTVARVFVRYDAFTASAEVRRGNPAVPSATLLSSLLAALSGTVLPIRVELFCRMGPATMQLSCAEPTTPADYVRIDAALTRLQGVAEVPKATSVPQAAIDVAAIPLTLAAGDTNVVVGGLAPQLAALVEMAVWALRPPPQLAAYGLRPPTGALLVGPPGTGKTLLARALAQRVRARLIVINGPEVVRGRIGESESKLRAIFAEARTPVKSARRAMAPLGLDEKAADDGVVGTLLFIDEIDGLCPRQGTSSTRSSGGEVEARITSTLATLLDEVSAPTMSAASCGVFVLAATNRSTAVDMSLRRPGRFDREIDVGVPSAGEREDILRVLLAAGYPHALGAADISAIAARCNGFVGADIAALCAEAARAALQRLRAAHASTLNNAAEVEAALTVGDFRVASRLVQPSALREVTVEVPNVSWDDIGGQEDAKARLREAVEWPLTHPEVFIALGIRPPKGILLYGPPGCSKTMMAKAMATEGRMNFIAVKGPELFSKYVGDSEKAVAETFRRARAAAPCIIFFDEFDALAGSRSSDSGESSGTSVGSRVVSQLLTELDGIAPLRRVVVVAATNRPDLIDAALLRPGRFDRLLYVGLPNDTARLRIIQSQLSRVPCDETLATAECVADLVVALEGYSGAEIVGIFRDAAVRAVSEDSQAPTLKRSHIDAAASALPRAVTPTMLAFYARFRGGATATR